MSYRGRFWSGHHIRSGPNGRGDRPPDRLEHLACNPFPPGAREVPPPPPPPPPPRQGRQIPPEVRPREPPAARGEAALQLLPQDEGQERAEHRPAARGVPLVEDRPGLQQRLRGPQEL